MEGIISKLSIGYRPDGLTTNKRDLVMTFKTTKNDSFMVKDAKEYLNSLIAASNVDVLRKDRKFCAAEVFAEDRERWIRNCDLLLKLLTEIREQIKTHKRISDAFTETLLSTTDGLIKEETDKLEDLPVYLRKE